MPNTNALFLRELKTEPLTVRSFQTLNDIRIRDDHFAASYRDALELPDGSVLLSKDFTVDRSIDSFKDDGIDFNGVNITLTDFILIGARLAEKWRQQDDAQRAADQLRDAGGPAQPLG